ncbi:hypothetical protein BESB_076790 [Besnoitia besnoiti]|uniref:Uncharacterized protein n=1 Tax=Besnoitia besnoiti TaxID=94643 RepID=A0A2A9MDL7_BESBE|nr:hypothetical protein BESB_076790 [Besnoitia besnoiti]PFH33462.1 hypothetical protein BESB_076790 [Besnoitia besnoiti]
MTPGGGGSLSAVSGGGFEGRRDSREKSSLPVVRGLPLLLLPQQVEVIWQAAADEEAAAARAVSGPASRELTQGTEASSATGTKPSHAEGSLSGVSSSAAAGNKTGPSSSDSGPPRRETGGGAQAASGQNPRGSAGGPSSGKKSVASSGQARETVAKGARDGGASAAGTKTQNASSSGTLAGASAPGCSRSGKVRPASGVTNQTSDGDGTVSSEAGTVASCVEATCRFLHLGPEGRRRPAVVDFHLFSLLFARDARMCPAKAALFVSVMGAALAEIEELAQTVSVTTLINTTKHKKAVKVE